MFSISRFSDEGLSERWREGSSLRMVLRGERPSGGCREQVTPCFGSQGQRALCGQGQSIAGFRAEP